MSIIIKTALQVPEDISKIFLISDTTQLKDFQFSDKEINYIRNKPEENEDIPFVIINRLDHFVGIIISELNDPRYSFIENIRRKGAELISLLQKEKLNSIAIMDLVDQQETALAMAEGIALGAYSFDKYKSSAKKKEDLNIIIVNPKINGCCLHKLTGVIESVYLARDLVNEPVGYLNAEKLGQTISALSKKHGFTAEVFNKKKIESLKMAGLLAVNRGSVDPPTFSVLEWKPKNAINKKPYVIIGKGVTFDTGGFNLKTPAGSMDTMKCDMGGAASVIGTMVALSANELPIYVVGLIPATDNRIGSNAMVPGDILKMANNTTVEVLNTDAEGRLILADALIFSKHYSPNLVIDLATLTGNAALAIGIHGIVAMGTADEEIMKKLGKAGDEVCERLVWFPFWDDYDESIKSDVADIKNVGDREGGAINAGKFLSKFIEDPWIHLDIAGPVFLNKKSGYRPVGGTGIGVRLLFRFFENLVSQNKKKNF